jgi:hypothetical protein
MVDYISITITAIFTGVGMAIGMPIGQYLYDKIKEHRARLKDSISLGYTG